MPGINLPLLKWVIEGTMESTQTWSCGFYTSHSGTDDPPTPAQLAACLNDLSDAFEEWASVCKAYWSAQTSYTGVALYAYDPNTIRARSVSRLTDDAIVGSGAAPHPTQTSLVASMRTELSGASSRGRCYMPYTAGTLDVSSQVPAGDCTTIANSWATLLTAVNSQDLDPHGITNQQCVVASFTTATAIRIDTVVVDSRPDIQRRRADNVPILRQHVSPVGP